MPTVCGMPGNLCVCVLALANAGVGLCIALRQMDSDVLCLLPCQPEVFTTNLCERMAAATHEECPIILRYDPQRMEAPRGVIATENDLVFCNWPCHRTRP